LWGSYSPGSEVAVAVLIAALLAASVSLQTSFAQESFPVLLGYGGRSYLPFVGGSELVFMVGETLVAYPPASEVVLKLFPPKGGPITLTLQPRSRVTVRTFGPEDVGTWTLEVPSGERMRVRVVDPNAPLFGTLSVEKWSDDQVLLRVQGSSAVGFEAEVTTGSPATLRALPGEKLTVSVPVPLRGTVVYLMYPDRLTLSGNIGGIPFTYSTDAVIARYDFDVPFGMTNFTVQLPLLGTVGPGGTFPLRYGTVVVQISGISPAGQRATFTQQVEVTLGDLLEKGVELVYLNYRTGKVERLRLNMPYYGIMVVDPRRDVIVADYSVTVPGHTDFRSGRITFYLPSAVSIPPSSEAEQRTLKLTGLKVHGFDVSRIVGEVELRPYVVTLVSVPLSSVKLRVRVAGTERLLSASLFVNGSGPVRVEGSATLVLPSAYYNLTAVTPLGTVSRVLGAHSDVDVDLVVYSFSEEAVLLLAAAFLQASVLGYLVLRALRLKHRAVGGSS
jgi:hypothetical protein